MSGYCNKDNQNTTEDEDKNQNEEENFWRQEVVDTSGLEPPTPTMSRWCSNQTELRVYCVSGLLVFSEWQMYGKTPLKLTAFLP